MNSLTPAELDAIKAKLKEDDLIHRRARNRRLATAALAMVLAAMLGLGAGWLIWGRGGPAASAQGGNGQAIVSPSADGGVDSSPANAQDAVTPFLVRLHATHLAFIAAPDTENVAAFINSKAAHAGIVHDYGTNVLKPGYPWSWADKAPNPIPDAFAAQTDATARQFRDWSNADVLVCTAGSWACAVYLDSQGLAGYATPVVVVGDVRNSPEFLSHLGRGKGLTIYTVSTAGAWKLSAAGQWEPVS